MNKRCASPTMACNEQNIRLSIVRQPPFSGVRVPLCEGCRAALSRPPFQYDVIVERRSNDLPWAIERRDRVSP